MRETTLLFTISKRIFFAWRGGCRVHGAQRNARVIRLAKPNASPPGQSDPRVHCAALHAPYFGSGTSRKVGRQSSGEPREFGFHARRHRAAKERRIGRSGQGILARWFFGLECSLACHLHSAGSRGDSRPTILGCGVQQRPDRACPGR